jgi:hypothetical protein
VERAKSQHHARFLKAPIVNLLNTTSTPSTNDSVTWLGWYKMLLPANYSMPTRWANHSNPPPRPSQQDSSMASQNDLEYDELNIILASVGLLLAFFTLLIGILQWQQFRRSKRSTDSVGCGPESESSINMDPFNKLLSFESFNTIPRC